MSKKVADKIAETSAAVGAKRVYGVVMAASVAVSAMTSQIGRADNVTKAQNVTKAKNVVLVHGLYADGSSWLDVIGALHGKVGGALTSSATQHGGRETTLFSIITNLLHFGMIILGLDYGHAGQMTLSEIIGGSPYGATTIAGADGSRQPTENELQGARYQGRKIARDRKQTSRLASHLLTRERPLAWTAQHAGDGNCRHKFSMLCSG
jgi:NAD(P)H dehydrogenase (quinone)